MFTIGKGNWSCRPLQPSFYVRALTMWLTKNWRRYRHFNPLSRINSCRSFLGSRVPGGVISKYFTERHRSFKNIFTRFSGGRLELRRWLALTKPRFSNILSLPFLAESFDLISTTMSSLGTEGALIEPATIDQRWKTWHSQITLIHLKCHLHF